MFAQADRSTRALADVLRDRDDIGLVGTEPLAASMDEELEWSCLLHGYFEPSAGPLLAEDWWCEALPEDP